MNLNARFDTARLTEMLVAEEASRRVAPAAWHLRRFLGALLSSAVLFMVLLPLVSGDISRAFDPASSGFWLRAGAALTLALLTATVHEIVQRRQGADPAAAAENRAREIRNLTSAGWPRGVLRMGVVLGLGIGIPVGAFLALRPEAPLAAADQIRVFGLFVVGTLAWTIPTAFILRSVTLYLHRRRGLLD
jgi:hypothetical protein